MEASGQLYAPGRFIRGVRAPGTHWIGGQVALEPVWTRCRGEEFPAPAGNRIPIIQPVGNHYTNWAVAFRVSLMDCWENEKWET
jgi:hypothetical protein